MFYCSIIIHQRCSAWRKYYYTRSWKKVTWIDSCHT